MRTFPMLTPSGHGVISVPLVPHWSTSMLCLCRTTIQHCGKEICHQSNRIMLHKVQESAASAVGDKHQAGEGWSATQMSSSKMCLMAIEPINNINTRLIEPSSGWHFSGSYKLSDWPFCVRATNLKSSVCSEITKHFWYKCHGLFDNSPVMTTVKSCLKFHSLH